MIHILLTFLFTVMAQPCYAMNTVNETNQADQYKPIQSVAFIKVLQFSKNNICSNLSDCSGQGTIVDIAYGLSCHERVISFDYKAIPYGKNVHLVVSIVAVSSAKVNDPACMSSVVYDSIELTSYFNDVNLTSIGDFL